MAGDLRRWQWWLTLLANWALVPFVLLTYRGGGPVWGLYLLIQVGTIWLNDKASASVWSLAILCVNLMAATGIAHWLSNTLYCSRVSLDGLSHAIGGLALIAGVMLAGVMSAVCIGARAWKGRR